MPNYEYQCTQCDHRFEIWQPVGEAAPECPNCSGAVKKVFHPPRIHFKGSGFYVTDLRAEKDKSSKASATNGGAEASEKSAASGESSGASEASGDSKPSGDAKPATETVSSETKTEAAPTPAADKKPS